MASLSTNAIGAANSAAKQATKSSAADNKNAGDTSPFELMLAATASQQQAKTAETPSDADQTAAKKPAGSNTDNTAQTAADAAAKTQSAAGQSAAAQSAAAQSAATQSAATKLADTESTDAEAAGIKAAQTKAEDKSDAANDNDSAQQTAPAVQQQPQQPTQAQPAQPDANILAMAQAALAQQQPQTATPATDSQAGANSGPAAIDAKSAKAQPGAGQSSGLPADAEDMADIADGIAPQTSGASAAGNGKNSTPAIQSGPKSAASDSKQTLSSADAGKIAQQSVGTPAPAAPPPPAPAATQSQPLPAMTNPAATPGGHQAAPIMGASNVSVSQSVQVGAQTPDTAATMGSLAVAIAAKTQSGSRQFDIRLDPPELGRVEVRLSIDASGKTEAHMTADQPETLNLLQKDSSSLTQALRDAGLDVSQSGLNFSLRGQNGNAANDNGAGRGSRSNLAASRVLDAAQGAASAISFTGSAADGRLDIHV